MGGFVGLPWNRTEGPVSLGWGQVSDLPLSAVAMLQMSGRGVGRTTTELPMTQETLAVRVWQGTPIQRRAVDGYVNATAMCAANGRRWAKYAESDRCKEYLSALAQRSEIRTFDLIEARPGRGGGTFVHPSLAIDLARWISPAFAVWMDGWFLESMAQPRPQHRQQLRPAIDPYRVAKVLPSCSRLNAAEILPQLGLPNTRANQMALAPVMTRLGYRKQRSMINGRRYWFYVGAVVPRGHVQQELDWPQHDPQRTHQLAPGVYVKADTFNEAHRLWCQTITAQVVSCLEYHLSPDDLDERPEPRVLFNRLTA